MSENKRKRSTGLSYLPREVLWIAAVFVTALTVMTVVWRTHLPMAPSTGGTLVFEDDFERAELGENYRQGEPDPGWDTNPWTIVDGRLHAKRIHNAAAWLQVPLPEKVRIEFDARAETTDGDVKAEVFGDGRTHQSGYILIAGGWRNSTSIIARRDEHGEDRKEDKRLLPRGAGKKRMAVEPGVDYRWVIERSDDTLRWYLNGELFLTYPDAHPIKGKHFAFNNWEAHVTFDNLKIYDLGR